MADGAHGGGHRDRCGGAGTLRMARPARGLPDPGSEGTRPAHHLGHHASLLHGRGDRARADHLRADLRAGLARGDRARSGVRVRGAVRGRAADLRGAGLALLLGTGTPVWQVGLTCFVIGAGMGLTASPTLIAAQSSVAWAQRGAVTGTNVFSRSLGSAVGVAAFGAVVNAVASTGPD